jgi:hypothetical protein
MLGEAASMIKPMVKIITERRSVSKRPRTSANLAKMGRVAIYMTALTTLRAESKDIWLK